MPPAHSVRPFRSSDYHGFIPNRFSRPPAGFLEQLQGYELLTLTGATARTDCILAFRNYHGTCWSGFVLARQGLPRATSLLLRQIMVDGMAERGATRLQTESVACPALRKWHRQMGFVLEGTRRRYMFGRDYDMWALLREGE